MQETKRDTIIFVAMIGSMIITAILGLFFLADAAEAQTPLSSTAVYEDQFMVCNFEDICITIDADDYMPQKAIDKIQNQFNNDIDTFDIGALD